MNDIDNYLNDIDKTHRPEEVPDFGLAEYPDGTYQVRLDKIYIDKSQTSQRIQTVMEFEIISGDYTFRKIKKYSGMMTGEQLDFLTSDLKRLGVPKDFKWNTLVKDYFPKLLDKTYEVQLKTKRNPKDGKDYQNTWITKEINTLSANRI